MENITLLIIDISLIEIICLGLKTRVKSFYYFGIRYVWENRIGKFKTEEILSHKG